MIPPYLKEVVIEAEISSAGHHYPSSITSAKKPQSLNFSDVTFFIGENGMGKSLLLESIAISMGIIPLMQAHSPLHTHIRCGRTHIKPEQTHYLPDPFTSARTHIHRQHGEAFMGLISNKLQGDGLYLFDEPESALSPSRQLNAMIALHKLVKKNSQIIMATHSPILLAYPNAKIYKLGTEGIKEIWYENTDNQKISKEIMNHADEMLRVIIR